MPSPNADTPHSAPTYDGDYLEWSLEYGDAIIDGVPAYVR